MDGQNVTVLTNDALLQILTILSVAIAIIGALLGYIWWRHTQQVDDQKKAIADLEENKAESDALSSAQENFERKLAELKVDMDRRSEQFERRHHDDVQMVRNEVNGLARRLEEAIQGAQDAVTRSEVNIRQHVEAVGNGFEKQMAMIIRAMEQQQKANEHQQGLMLELTRVLNNGQGRSDR